MSAKFPRGGGGAGPFLARSLMDTPVLIKGICAYGISIEISSACSFVAQNEANLFHLVLAPRL